MCVSGSGNVFHPIFPTATSLSCYFADVFVKMNVWFGNLRRYAAFSGQTRRKLPVLNAQRPPSFTVREFDARAVPAEVISGGTALESRALEPNAYLSPHIVLPAARHLDPELPVLVLVVEL